MIRSNIEDFESSFFSHNIRFTTSYLSPKGVIRTRRKYINITQMIWITNQLVIDSGYNVYNPKSLIMLFLN